MQHPEYVGKMNLPDVKNDPRGVFVQGIVNGLTLFGAPPGEGAAVKLAAGHAAVRVVSRQGAGDGGRSAAAACCHPTRRHVTISLLLNGLASKELQVIDRGHGVIDRLLRASNRIPGGAGDLPESPVDNVKIRH